MAAVPDRARAAVHGQPDAALRRRPEPDTWSAVEYLCHLRDVYVTTTIRLHRARTEELPVVEPMLNDLRARRFRYADSDVPAVLGELAAAVAGVADELRRVGPDGWERRVLRGPGRSARSAGCCGTPPTRAGTTWPTSTGRWPGTEARSGRPQSWAATSGSRVSSGLRCCSERRSHLSMNSASSSPSSRSSTSTPRAAATAGADSASVRTAIV